MPDPGKNDSPRDSDTARRTYLAGEQAQEPALRPLLRLRQLTEEIQSAFRRGDMEVVGQAANLLAPTLSQWTAARSGLRSGSATGEAELTRLTQETQCALMECESLMQAAMAQVQSQSSHVRQQQQQLHRVRSQRGVPRTGRVLDARR